MEYFARLDVSLRSCAICVVDAKGKVMLERELPCEVGDMAPSSVRQRWRAQHDLTRPT
jgi:hypothetical protein